MRRWEFGTPGSKSMHFNCILSNYNFINHHPFAFPEAKLSPQDTASIADFNSSGRSIYPSLLAVTLTFRAWGFFPSTLLLKNTMCMHVCVPAQSCLTFWNNMDCSGPPGSSVHGIFQAEILEWVAISSSRGSSRPRDWTWISSISCTGRWVLYHCAT